MVGMAAPVFSQLRAWVKHVIFPRFFVRNKPLDLAGKEARDCWQIYDPKALTQPEELLLKTTKSIHR